MSESYVNALLCTCPKCLTPGTFIDVIDLCCVQCRACGIRITHELIFAISSNYTLHPAIAWEALSLCVSAGFTGNDYRDKARSEFEGVEPLAPLPGDNSSGLQ